MLSLAQNELPDKRREGGVLLLLSGPVPSKVFPLPENNVYVFSVFHVIVH